MKVMSPSTFPKISIVTPSFNQGEFLEETICSVLNQNYPNLEYIIIDGGSTDNSVEIIRKYEKHLKYWISEKDKGVYDAIQKGFAQSTGEIMAWINSDDLYHPLSFLTIAEIFTSFPEVSWLQGNPSGFDEKSRNVALQPMRLWSRYNFYLKDFAFIQQESTFWRRTLWEKAGSGFDPNLKYAGDLELWLRFFRHERLFVTDALIAGFRFRSSNQLSFDNQEKYLIEAHTCIESEPLDEQTRKAFASIRKLKSLLSKMRYFQIGRLKLKYYKLFNYPPVIKFNRLTQKFELKNLVDFSLAKS
jgi:glycosyltransferase involved in cell wall biosynthesis